MEHHLIDQYRKNGYLLLSNFFNSDLIESILSDAKYIFIRQFIEKKYITELQTNLTESQFNEFLFQLFKEDLACLSNCGKQAQHMIELHRLSLHQSIIDLLKEIGLSSPIISTRPILYFNHEKLSSSKVFHTVEPHQDWRSMQGSLNSVVIWMPLVNIDKSLGALEVIPKSHLWGLKTDHIENGFGMMSLTPAEKEKFISIEVQTGDILIFSSFLVHQSGTNITDKPRWSCHFRYNDLNEQTFIERMYAHPYIYKPAEKLITEHFPTTEDLKKIFLQ